MQQYVQLPPSVMADANVGARETIYMPSRGAWYDFGDSNDLKPFRVTNMRVLIADDHPLVIDALQKYFMSFDPNVEVIRATNLKQALASAHRSSDLDLIILDLYLPDVSGIEGLTRLHSQCQDVPIVIISGIADRHEMMSALDRGAAGFIPKNLSPAAIVKALELVLTGERYVPSILLTGRGLSDKEVDYKGIAASETGSPLDKLTHRQREVLALLFDGNTNKKIAFEMGVKEITAAFHLRGLFKKLNVSNRTQAVTMAVRLGWKPPDVSRPLDDSIEGPGGSVKLS